MPVILPPLADPFDFVLQGEQLRSLALTQSVDGSGFPAPSLLGSALATTALGPLVPGDGDVLSMIGQDWSQGAPHESQALLRNMAGPTTMIAANAVISTPTGALIPWVRGGIVLPVFVQASQLWAVQGTTRDQVGAPLGFCRVVVLETGRIEESGMPVVGETTSDAGGNYSVPAPMNTAYQVIAYKPGSPDVAGITRADVVPDANG